MWAERIVRSYEAATGTPLCPAVELYDLDAAVLCHDTADDPLFVYANRTAQRLWERDWPDFIGWPSRLTAPPAARAERAEALASAGVVRGYRGVRINRSGRLFEVRAALIVTVTDDSAARVGQAAVIPTWTYVD